MPVSDRAAGQQAPVEVAAARETSDIVLKALLVLAVFYTFYFARVVLLPVVLALLLTLILSPAVRALRKLRLPEPLGAALVVAALVGSIGVGVYSLIEPAAAWLERLPGTVRQVENKMRGIKKSVQEVTKAADKVEELASISAKPPVRTQAAVPGPGLLSRILTGTQSVLLSAAATVVLLYFLLASGDMFLRKLVRVLPRLTDKKQAVEIARTIQSGMARYLFTITCINAGLGIVTGFAMHWLGMPNPVLWGAMAAVFNYIPYVGAGTSLIVLTAVAFLTFDQIGQIFIVPAVFFIITVVEGQIIAPILTGKSLTLNPVVIFISMLVWGWLWGVIGALMAVPILMTFKICCDQIESLAPIGEFLSGRRIEADAQ